MDPNPTVYEQEINFMPYIDSFNAVLDLVVKQAPQNGTLLDVMCGPGYFLNKIYYLRKDLLLAGVDISKEYIDYSRKKYPNAQFFLEDILKWKCNTQYDFVVCTGSLHHIPYSLQAKAIKKFASFTKEKGTLIISDCYIDDYNTEGGRKVAAAKLGFEYLKETIKNKAPKEVIQEAINILNNDVFKKEFKTSIAKREVEFEKIFSSVKTKKIWPRIKSGYGDYISILKK